ncbi:MAG: BCCT family transporter, partial [Pseudomonadota bacterium]
MASVEMSAELPPARTFLSPLLLCSLGLTAAIAVWGVVDNQGLAQVAREAIQTQFSGRAWFIMLTVSGLLLVSIGLACSRFGDVVLGQDGDQPEFSTISWLSMLFAAGMGVGLLYWGTAEPLTHYLIIKPSEAPVEPAPGALFITNFHWGFHAWAIYAMTGLVIAYFTFRRGAPSLVSAPLLQVYGVNAVTRSCGWLFDLLAIVAISIGLGGSIAMGIFQIEDGLQALFGVQDVGRWLTFTIFAVLCVCYVPPLMVDLGRGMSMLSNAALGIAILLLVFILLAGPTAYLMGGVVQG